MKRCLLFLLLAFALAVPATASATTYGAGLGGVFINQQRGQWSAANVMSSLNALHAAGGRIGRADSDWAGAEPRPPVHGHHTYHWDYDDTIVSEMAQAHLTWEPTLEYAPKWAQEHKPDVLHLKSGRFVTPLPPAKNSNFAAYATAFMRRYGVHGSFWRAHSTLAYLPIKTVEVWNEPDNNHNWGPDVNLQQYATMYEAVRTAIHRVSRGTRVMTGGLAWTQSSLPRLLKAFDRKPIDAVAVHPSGPTQRGRSRWPTSRSPRCASSAAAGRRWSSTSTAGPRSATPGVRPARSTSRVTRIRRWSASRSCTCTRSCRSPGPVHRGPTGGAYKRAVAHATHNRL